jgi:hypothetical protein
MGPRARFVHEGSMAAASHAFEMPLLAPRRLRHKSMRRRVAREVRLSGPIAAVWLVAVLAFAVTLGVERIAPASSESPQVFTPRTEYAYSEPTISISSTSKVNAAPPGIFGGAPLSP